MRHELCLLLFYQLLHAVCLPGETPRASWARVLPGQLLALQGLTSGSAQVAPVLLICAVLFRAPEGWLQVFLGLFFVVRILF